MSGAFGAPCTLELKKKPRQEWEKLNKPDFTVLGFTVEEKRRAERFKLTERDSLLVPLIDEGLTKQDCFNILRNAGIDTLTSDLNLLDFGLEIRATNSSVLKIVFTST